MVKVDPDPVERVRWTSTRRANRDDNDDLDADSIMRGGVCRRPALPPPPSAAHPAAARAAHTARAETEAPALP